MRVLGIDTATSLCTVGIAGDEGFEADYRINRGYIHGEYLSVVIKQVMKASGISLSDIDGFAVSIGPGSFTGLRIGLSVIKGIVLGYEKPVAAVDTMDGLINRIPPVSDNGCVMLTARKGEIYQGKYRFLQGRWQRQDEYQIVSEKNIGNNFKTEETVFIGDGVDKFFSIIEERVKRPKFLQPEFSLPSGFSIAKLGREMIRQKKQVDIETVVPLYLKRFKGVM